MDFRLFIPITKVDVAKRLVYGTIAEEIPDKSGEIMDYETARPEFEAWSAEIGRASSGKSAGNLRAMHGSVAAGRLDRIVFDDKEKRIATVAKVVDDTEAKQNLVAEVAAKITAVIPKPSEGKGDKAGAGDPHASSTQSQAAKR